MPSTRKIAYQGKRTRVYIDKLGMASLGQRHKNISAENEREKKFKFIDLTGFPPCDFAKLRSASSAERFCKLQACSAVVSAPSSKSHQAYLPIIPLPLTRTKTRGYSANYIPGRIRMAACVPPPRCRRGRRGGNGRDAARGAGRERVGWPHERRAVGRAHQIRRLGAEGQMFGFLTVARGTARKPTNLGC